MGLTCDTGVEEGVGLTCETGGGGVWLTSDIGSGGEGVAYMQYRGQRVEIICDTLLIGPSSTEQH